MYIVQGESRSLLTYKLSLNKKAYQSERQRQRLKLSLGFTIISSNQDQQFAHKITYQILVLGYQGDQIRS